MGEGDVNPPQHYTGTGASGDSVGNGGVRLLGPCAATVSHRHTVCTEQTLI